MSVVAARGFAANGLAAGIKESGAFDLAVVTVEPPRPVVAAATFTTNKAAAAPVLISRAHLEATAGCAGAVVLNSGCANAATGASGLEAARRTAEQAAALLGLAPEEVLVCSTGLIGDRLPTERLLGALADLVEGRGGDAEAGDRAATAILTTDTHDKQVLVERRGFVVGGMAKGAGMIAPNMATMLCVLTTDAAVTAEQAHTALRAAVAETFNELTVDGCTSTNDTVILLASGLGATVDTEQLAEALTAACANLAFQLAEDAEGTTRVARIVVKGAVSVADARRAARRVAESNLVKTSLFGADPYWGRVVSELGSAGAEFDLDKVSVAYGSTVVFAAGLEVAHDRQAVAEYLAGRVVEIGCDLGLGTGETTVTTCDLGHGYIDENMRTS